jgi:hypothetical protein
MDYLELLTDIIIYTPTISFWTGFYSFSIFQITADLVRLLLLLLVTSGCSHNHPLSVATPLPFIQVPLNDR